MRMMRRRQQPHHHQEIGVTGPTDLAQGDHIPLHQNPIPRPHHDEVTVVNNAPQGRGHPEKTLTTRMMSITLLADPETTEGATVGDTSRKDTSPTGVTETDTTTETDEIWIVTIETAETDLATVDAMIDMMACSRRLVVIPATTTEAAETTMMMTDIERDPGAAARRAASHCGRRRL